NANFIAAFWRSLLIGVIVGLGAVMLGTLLSLALTRHRFRGEGAVNFLVIAPFIVPNIVLAVGLVLVLSAFGVLDSYLGIVIAHIGITIPYTVRTVTMSLMSVDRRVDQADL